VRVRRLAEADASRWTDLVAAHPGATLYHSLLWRDVVQKVFGHAPWYLIGERDGVLVGVMPMFRVRMPFVGDKLVSMPYDLGAGGPLAVDQDAECAMMEFAVDLARSLGVGWLECRTGSPRESLERLGLMRTEPAVMSEMVLQPGQDPWRSVSPDNRQSIRKAANRGVTVREAVSLEDYGAFYQVYLRVFRDFGTPPYGRRYFPTVYRLLHEPRHARLFLASVQGRVVGGLLLYCWGTSFVSKFAAVASEAIPLRASAALYGRAIDCAVEEGATRLSWGTSSQRSAGLIQFKQRWGAQTHPAAVYCVPVRRAPPPLERYYNDDGLAQRVWRRFPVGITPALGGILNRWFC
jgi:hypothetical protein